MADDSALQASLDARKAEVDRLVRGSSGAQAVVKSLEDPPFGSRNEAIKSANTEIVLSAMGAVSDANIGSVVDGLNENQCDVLMKYVYKGLERGENSGSLFKWHAKVQAKAGLGSIVRAMSDRKSA